MAQIINTNLASLNAQRNLNSSQGSLNTSLQRLSSGLRINSAKDDAAGLAISNKLTSQINGLNVAVRNANDGISLAQTAEGAMQEGTTILQRMRELALQSANGTNSAEEREALNAEAIQLKNELDRISTTTRFGGKLLLDGNFTESVQVGARANETISVGVGDFRTTAMGTRAERDATAAVATGAKLTTENLTLSSSGTTATPGEVNIDFDDYEAPTGSSATIQIGGENIAVSTNATDGSSLVSEIENELPDGYEVTFDGDTNTLTITNENGDVDANLTTIGLGQVTSNNYVAADGDANNSFTVALGDEEVTVSLADGTYTAESLADAINQQLNSSALKGEVRASISEGQIQFKTTATGSDAALTLKAVDDNDGLANLGFADEFEVSGQDAGTSSHSVEAIDISTSEGAQNAIATIDAALAEIDATRGDLGAIQNRFSSTIANLENIAENVSAARARIQDADFAQETANLTKNQILQQAGVSVLSQANALPQQVLSLLQ